MSCPRFEPIDFLIPTSVARFSDRAVLKLIKLIHASNKINVPIIPNSHTFSIRPPTCLPFSKSSLKYQSSIGNRNISGLNSANSGAAFTFISIILEVTASIVVLSLI